MKDVPTDRAKIIAPPPVIYLGVLGLGLLFEWLWPTRLLTWPLAVAAGSAIFICGVAGLAVAIRTLLRARTPVDPYKGTTAIVTDGLFRFSRNPIYVSDMLLYVGLALALNAWWALALTPAVVWIMNTGVIAREEMYLEQKFGNDYLQYKQQVRRWL
jgi:protein-S-isoprenylcysteine O-methyltransferase Ste14